MVSDIINQIVSAFTSFISGLGTGIVDFFKGLVTNENGELTELASWGLAFLGLGFAVSIVYALLRKIG